MNRRSFIAGLVAVATSIFGTKKTFGAPLSVPRCKSLRDSRLSMNQSYYGETIPVIYGNAEKSGITLGNPGVTYYGYTWKQHEDGTFSDFKAILSSTGTFTIPAEYAGQPFWVPALMSDSQWPAAAISSLPTIGDDKTLES